MTDEQIEAYDRFAQVASRKGYNQIVCLAAGSIMLSSSDWKRTITDIIALAEECKNCEEFGHRLLAQF